MLYKDFEREGWWGIHTLSSDVLCLRKYTLGLYEVLLEVGWMGGWIWGIYGRKGMGECECARGNGKGSADATCSLRLKEIAYACLAMP